MDHSKENSVFQENYSFNNGFSFKPYVFLYKEVLDNNNMKACHYFNIPAKLLEDSRVILFLGRANFSLCENQG